MKIMYATSAAVLAVAGVLAQARNLAEPPSDSVVGKRSPAASGIIEQSTDSSCGAASLASIARYWLGMKSVTEESVLAKITSLRADASSGARPGVSVGNLMRAADSLGLVSTAHLVPATELHKLSKPVIALIERESLPPHFVIVKGVRNGRVELADVSPGMGHVHEAMASFEKQWAKDGVGLLVTVDRADGLHLVNSTLSLAGAAGNHGRESISVGEALLRRGTQLATGKLRFATDMTFGRSTDRRGPDQIGVRSRAREVTASITYAPSDATAVWTSLSWISQTLQLRDPTNTGSINSGAGWSDKVVGPIIVGASSQWLLNNTVIVEPAGFVTIPTTRQAPARIGGRLGLQGAHGSVQTSTSVEVDRRLTNLADGVGTSRVSAALQFAWLPTEALALSGGLARTYRDDQGFPATSMSVGIMRAIDPELAIRATLSTSIAGPPTRTASIGVVYTPRRKVP
jgi:hypothetical protein